MQLCHNGCVLAIGDPLHSACLVVVYWTYILAELSHRLAGDWEETKFAVDVLIFVLLHSTACRQWPAQAA